LWFPCFFIPIRQGIVSPAISPINAPQSTIPRRGGLPLAWSGKSRQAQGAFAPFDTHCHASLLAVRCFPFAAARGNIELSMSNHNRPSKWKLIDEATAKALTKKTDAPNGVYQVPTSEIPENFKTMPGIDTFYVSGYVDPQVINQGLTLGGEMAITRIEGATAIHYNYVLASSADGKVYSMGPFKDFPYHHSPSASPVPIEDLFGHHPFKQNRKE